MYLVSSLGKVPYLGREGLAGNQISMLHVHAPPSVTDLVLLAKLLPKKANKHCRTGAAEPHIRTTIHVGLMPSPDGHADLLYEQGWHFE